MLRAYGRAQERLSLITVYRNAFCTFSRISEAAIANEISFPSFLWKADLESDPGSEKFQTNNGALYNAEKYVIYRFEYYEDGLDQQVSLSDSSSIGVFLTATWYSCICGHLRNRRSKLTFLEILNVSAMR